MCGFELFDGSFQIFDICRLLVVLFYELLNFDQESRYLIVEFKDLLLKLRSIGSLYLTDMKPGLLDFSMQNLHLFILLEEIILEKL